jgi:hypothetical protein
MTKASKAIDEGTRKRAARFKALLAEIAQMQGYASPDDLAGYDRERLHLTATLMMQREQVTADLLSGKAVAPDAVVKLSEAITTAMPAKVQKPMVLQIEFVGEPSAVEAALHERIDELEKQLAKARALPVVERGVVDQRADEQTRVRPSQSQPEPCHDSAAEAIPGMGMLVEANRAWSSSPYGPVDTFDAAGRRLDADGLPQSRRIDRDGA